MSKSFSNHANSISGRLVLGLLRSRHILQFFKFHHFRISRSEKLPFVNQNRMCGKGVGLGLFPSEVEKWPFLAMFLTSQPYDFDAIAHIGL